MSAPSSLGAAVKLYRFFPPTKCWPQTYRNIFAWQAAFFLRTHFSVVESVNRAAFSHFTTAHQAALVSEYFIISFRRHILRCSRFCTIGKGALCCVVRPSDSTVRTNYLLDNMRCEYSSQNGKVKEMLKAVKKREEIQEVIHEKKKRIKESGQLLLKEIRETREKMKERMEEVVETENVWTIPNMLCVMRIGVSPLLGYLILQSNYTAALGLLSLAGISDVLDGWIARTFENQASKMGSFLDPMADKVLIAVLFLSLTYMDLIPVILTGAIITRDLLLVGAGFFIRYQSLPPPRTLSRYFDVTHATAQLAPTTISKVNTAVQLLLVATTLAAPVFNYVDHQALHVLWYITAGTTVTSAVSYLVSKNTYKYLKPKK